MLFRSNLDDGKPSPIDALLGRNTGPTGVLAVRHRDGLWHWLLRRRARRLFCAANGVRGIVRGVGGHGRVCARQSWSLLGFVVVVIMGSGRCPRRCSRGHSWIRKAGVLRLIIRQDLICVSANHIRSSRGLAGSCFITAWSIVPLRYAEDGPYQCPLYFQPGLISRSRQCVSRKSRQLPPSSAAEISAKFPRNAREQTEEGFKNKTWTSSTKGRDVGNATRGAKGSGEPGGGRSIPN